MFSIVDASTSREPPQTPINWAKCFLCQKTTSERLLNPKQAPAHQTAVTGCAMLASNLVEFHAIGELPFPIDSLITNDLAEIKKCLEENNAVWHRSCYLKCNNTKLKRAKAKYEAKKRSSPSSHPSPKKTRRTCDASHSPDVCLFCDKPAARGIALHQVQTPDCDEYIRKGAEMLRDTKLKAKSSERCDLIALEAKYHLECYAKFKKRVQQQENGERPDERKQQIEALAFAGLVSYLKEVSQSDADAFPVFSMPQLSRLYAEGMQELGYEYNVHATRLKDRILEACPFLQAHEQKGRETLISVRKDVNAAMQKLIDHRRDYDAESKVFCDAATAARNDVFKSRDRHEENLGNSPEDVTAPPSMLAFVKLLFNGPCKRSGGEDGDDYVDQSIAQLLTFHIVKRRYSKSRRHTRLQETPVPCYLAMKLYGETRKRKLIDTTYSLGMSISYSRLDSILTEKANEVCAHYHASGVVCPPSAICGQNIFTTASVDNIDHITSSTSAMTSFHGTAISLMQHFLPSQMGVESHYVQPSVSENTKRRTVMKLPEEYTIVRPCFTDVRKAPCTLTENYDISGRLQLFDETSWLNECVDGQCVPWSAFHTAQDTGEKHVTKTALLPLFREHAASAAMMKHTMDVVAKAVKRINERQVPVVGGDQPLYALLKQVQYTFPDTHGEDKYFVMMGGLHIEMAALRVVGDWLDGSGWVTALLQAEVTTEGRAESLIKAGHVTRTRYAIQVTVVALFALQRKAYAEYCEQESDEFSLSFEDWRTSRSNEIPHFRYWNTAMTLCLLVLQLVRAQRTAHFDLYVTSLRQLVPWFFALDHVHYARWLSVHVRDLTALQDTHPGIYREFQRGLFVARTTGRAFSAMGLDQAHEQMNARIKGDGGMIGITESHSSLIKWLLAAPELASLVNDFEKDHMHMHDKTDPASHHDESPAARLKFKKDVHNLTEVFAELGNPFLEDSKDEIYNLETKKVASAEVITTVMTIDALGESLYRAFVKERLETGEKSLMDSIQQNKLALLGTAGLKKKSNAQVKMSTLKQDCSLFRRLYISTCNSKRQSDLDEFFKHENQPEPPALSFGGEPTSCTKSDLIDCLIAASDDATADTCPTVDAKIMDGPAIVHLLGPQGSKTFTDYLDSVVTRFVNKELESVTRVDFVWDRYEPKSLKNFTRIKRGDGVRTRVTLTTKVPKNWARFLREATNKQELFSIVASKVVTLGGDGNKEVYSTVDRDVLTSSERDVTGCLAPCNHEEADTRIMIHVKDALVQGHHRIMIRTVDTDVVVLAVSCVQQLPGIQELWIHIGTGSNQRFIAAHTIAESLGPAMSRGLPVFHAFTGCDQVSSFRGRSKNTAFEAWMSFPDVTDAFLSIAGGNVEEAMPLIEKFVVALYDRSCSSSTVNECRKYLIVKKDRQVENIPPSYGALKKHTERAMYIGGCVWGHALDLNQTLPSPAQFGWDETASGWMPKWSTLPPASKACRELLKCSCKKGCTNRCKCVQAGLGCSERCRCSGNCKTE